MTEDEHILISLEPRHAESILEGRKTVELRRRAMNVSIYNHQLCVLKPELWKYAKKSISDWKNIYIEKCEGCELKDDCGGFFKWATKLHSAHIHPLRRDDARP